MAIYDEAPPVFKTDAEQQAQFIRGSEAEIAETSEDLPIPEIPTFPYKSRKMSVEGMKKQLESSNHLKLSEDQFWKNLGLGKNGQALPTSITKKPR